MTRHYLNKRAFAQRLGITEGALGTLNMPEPDVIVGEGPRATRGWSVKTIDEWNAKRRGSGNWSGKDAPKARK
ncbi:transcriptional regulator [Leucobacter sp. Z1108]|uniref:transcriptional regulator n=1 Tax=Leucobacter sp. Z1108 TaxID=3439066 RepID=UPI003F2A6304